MNCPSCGTANSVGQKFCGECGGRLQSACPHCGFENPSGFRFCGECGAPLQGSGPRAQASGIGAPEPRTRNPEPRSYTPKHLAEKILTSRSALEGERKQVTVLFADVKGSMDLAEHMDPEEWSQVMQRFFGILCEGVERFEGFVDKFTGDGIMALFGAPIAHEDHAPRACHAALYLRDRLKRHGEELKRTRGLGFSVRMGLNSGEVVVGKIGDDLRMEYTAQGHVVGLAQRIEDRAEPGAVYLGEATAKLISGYFELRDLGDFQLKGVRESVRLYELQREAPLRGRFDVARRRGLSPFVGREKEIGILEAALERVLQGHAVTIGIVAQAGIGKSRLVYELLEQCRRRGIARSVTSCLPHGKGIPLHPLLQAMRDFYGIGERDDAETCRKKITGQMLRLDPGLAQDVPIMLDFLGVGDPDQSAPHMDPEARQRGLIEILRRQRLARGRVEPLVFVVEDLHWVDAATEAVLTGVTRGTDETSTLQIWTFRPEYRPAWVPTTAYEQISLQPLRPESTQALVDHLLGAGADRQHLAHRIQQTAAGNPFFIEEIVLSLAESGALAGSPGAYELTGPIEELRIPDSVKTVLAARIDRASEREKSVLQAASVIGKRFPLNVLERIVDLALPQLQASLDALADSQFVYQESAVPEVEYAFKHPLTQEVAYGSQLHDRRERVHRRLASAFEEIYADKMNEKAALIAHHWEAAGAVLPAARWHRRAAGWIGSRDGPAAVRHWRHVRQLTAGEELPEEAVELHVEACCQILGFSRLVTLSEDEVLSLFETGSVLARKRSDYRSLALLHGWLGNSRALDGKVDEYLQHAGEAVRLAGKTDDRALQLFIRIPQAYSHYLHGDLEEALALTKEGLVLSGENVSLGASFSDLSPYIWFVMMSGYLGVEMGNLTAADSYLSRAVDLARRHGRWEILTWTLVERTILAQHKGERSDAESCAREALACAEKMGGANQRGNALVGAGIAHNLGGNWVKSVDALQEALAIARKGRAFLQEEALILIHLAEAYMGMGDSERAGDIAREAVAVARRGNRMRECRAQLALSRALLRRGGAQSHAAIRAVLTRATELVETTGARTYPPFIAVERAALAHLLDDQDTRRRHLREAHRLFTAMGATGHAERLGKEMGC